MTFLKHSAYLFFHGINQFLKQLADISRPAAAGKALSRSGAGQMKAIGAQPLPKEFPDTLQQRELQQRKRPTLQHRQRFHIATTPCWVITLNPDGERASSLMAELKAQRLLARLIPGVDGRHGLPKLESGERLANFTTRWRHLSVMDSSEVGCYLAHLRAIRRAYESGLERICILEDDVSLEPEFGKVLVELEQLPAEVEMVRLMGLKVRRRKEIQPLAGGAYKLVRPERGWTGTQGYLINRVGMKKVLEYGSRICEPIDKLYDHFWQFDLRLYGVEPHLLWEREHESSIVKSCAKRDKVAIWLYCLHPFGKLWRSLERRCYLWRNAREFYPAHKPKGRLGRTKRIKL